MEPPTAITQLQSVTEGGCRVTQKSTAISSLRRLKMTFKTDEGKLARLAQPSIQKDREKQ